MRIFSWFLAALAGVSLAFGPVQAQGTFEIQGWHNVRISCMHMQGLVQNLHQVRDIMQVYNNDRATWNSKNGCVNFRNQPTLTRDFLGWYDTGRFIVGIEVVRYQNIPDPPRDPNKKGLFGLRIKNTQNDGALRPIVIERADRYRMAPYCRQATVTLNGVTLFGNDGFGPLDGCIPRAGYDARGHAGPEPMR